jgi:hypothetical protein
MNKNTSSQKRLQWSIAVGIVVFLFIIMVSMVWSRGRLPLGNDSFCYLEWTKRFMAKPPDRFGDWWPFGYPLLGSILGRLGIPPFHALIMISALAYASISALFIWALGKGNISPRITLLIIAACCLAPAVPLLVTTPMSEPLFAALLFGMAICLGYWPNRLAIFGAMLMMLCAFCVRYAGVFAFSLIPCYALLVRKSLLETRTLRFAASSWIVCLVVASTLCYTNYRVFGRFTGPQPVGKENPLTLPFHFADLGYGGLGVLFSGGARLLKRWAEGVGPLFSLSIGWAVMLGVCFLLFQGWRRASTPFVRPMVIVASAYLLAIAVLRSITPFDNLDTPRTFVPAVFPLAFVFISLYSVIFKKFITIMACGIICFGITLAWRGMSLAVNPDVSIIANELKSRLDPNDTIVVDDCAIALAAKFPNTFLPTRVDSAGVSEWRPSQSRFSVFGTCYSHGQRGIGPDPAWKSLVDTAVSNGLVTVVYSDSNGIILESNRVDPPSSRKDYDRLSEVPVQGQ